MSVEDAFVDMASQQFESMEKDSNDFSKRMERQRGDVDAMMDKLMGRMGRRNAVPSYSEDITKIASTLTAFPKLVPVVQSLLNRFLVEMEKKFDEIAKEYITPKDSEQ
jgi:hypothetical protein